MGTISRFPGATAPEIPDAMEQLANVNPFIPMMIKSICKVVGDDLDKLGRYTVEHVDALEARCQALEERLAELEK